MDGVYHFSPPHKLPPSWIDTFQHAAYIGERSEKKPVAAAKRTEIFDSREHYNSEQSTAEIRIW